MNKFNQRKRRRASPLGVFIILLLISVVTFFVLTYKRWEGQSPGISLDRDVKALGRNPVLNVTVDDAGTGLKQVSIRLRQNNQDVVLTDEALTGGETTKTYDVAQLIKGKIQEGAATIVVTASDNALRSFGGGNTSELTKDFQVDTKPPRIEVLSSQHYINQGGSECVVYRASEDAEVSGVQVGPYFFPGSPIPDSKGGERFALFAFRYDLPSDTQVKVIARDAAGNEAIAGIQQKVFPKGFRSRDIVIDDAFLNKVVPEIMSNTQLQDQGDIVKNFVEINSKLRVQNHETITKLSNESAPGFLWKGGFVQLSNSKVEAAFADRRTYLHNGAKIDQQDHVGFDLSVVQQTPIEASNDGTVIYADYFGIYGNAVMIDHGAGLISLYGHLSSVGVKPGQMVKKKDIVGRSGATGMAGGDHLHFGLFLRGVPVNPTEWWDEKWINDHVLARLKSS
jgi:murein DD-endopeptidase MepM/ murein hydrolase activator NlpD